MMKNLKPMKKKDLIMLDEEVALKLQAEFDEDERLARENDEANVALTEEWDDIQANIDADYQLALRLQAEEQEELFVEEKAKLFQQLLEQRRKHFAAKKLKDLKNKSFDSIQKMFDRAFKRVNTFVDFRTDLVECSSKRAGAELEQESTKKQKVEDDKETVELQKLMEIIPDEEEVAIDAIPLAVKSPRISTFLEDAVYADLHVGREKVSSYTTKLSMMLEKKLQIDYESEMLISCYKLIIKQLK
ncbi:hypothetical protein Tco_1082806 [Tanacetum coccineum]|uniref:Uncharacterized protein n=1 Tax=Tanacetum coccineum TaxID=301880 RepID=A0ABQ5I1F4_9ASTR